MGTRVRLGVIGLSQGFYATVYARFAAAMKGVDMVGVCDCGMPDSYALECTGMLARDLAEQTGAALFHRPEDLLAVSPDAVIVASETCDHAAHAVAALNAGASVFVCKPIALLPEDVEHIHRLAVKRGLRVLPGQPARYEEGMVEAAKRVESGEIGRPLLIRLLVNHEAMLSPAWERDPRRSGGPLGTFGIYCFDLVRWVTGLEFTEVFAYGDDLTLRAQVGDLDNVAIVGRLTGGAIASMCLTSSIRWTYPLLDLELVGEQGTLRAGYHNYAVITQGPRGARLSQIRYSPMNQNEVSHFIAVVRGLEEPRISLLDARRAAELIVATRASIARRAIVPVATP